MSEENPKSFKICPRKTTLFLLSGVVLVALIAMAAFGWRLHKAPMDLGFAKDYIGQAIASSELFNNVSFERAVLFWPDLEGPIYLGLRGVTVFGNDDLQILDVEEILLSLSHRHHLFGSFVPKSIIINEPTLKITRLLDDSVGIGFGASQWGMVPQTAGDNNNSYNVESIYRQVSSLFFRDDQSASHRYEIRNAYLIYDDAIWGMALVIPDADFQLSKNDAGNIVLGSQFKFTPDLISQNEEFSALVEISQSDARLKVDLNAFDPTIILSQKPAYRDFQNIDASVDASLSAALDDTLTLQQADFETSVDQGVFVHPEWFSEPIELDDFLAQASFEPGDESGQRTIVADKIEGRLQRKIPFSGSLNYALDDVQIIETDVTIPRAPMADFASLMPEFLQGKPIYIWVKEKLSAGALKDIRMQARFADKDVADLKLDYAFEDLQIAYKSTMTPVTKAQGSAKFDYNQGSMDIVVNDGLLDRLTLKDASVALRNIIEAGQGSADIAVPLSGPLSSVMGILSEEPLSIAHRFTPENNNQLSGHFDGVIALQMPTKADLLMEDIVITADATVKDIIVPDLLKKLEYKAENTALDIENDTVRISGSGLLSDRPINFEYETFLNASAAPYKRKTTASLNLDPNLRQHFEIDLEEYIQGTPEISFEYIERASGLSEMAVNADLNDSILTIKPFHFNKAAGEEGTAQAKLILRDEELRRIENLSVSSNGLLIQNAILRFSDEKLTTGEFPKLQVGFTDLSGAFELKKDGAYHISAQGPSLDFRPFLSSKKEQIQEPTDPLVISVKADLMQTADDRGIAQTQLYAAINSGGQIEQLEMDASAGAGDIYLRYKPDEQGQKNFRLEADDAGAMLRAFGLYENIQGGQLTIIGQPISNIYQRNVEGRVQISDFRIVNAPYLARLVSGLSLTNANNLLINEGLGFSKLEADFDWLYQPGGSVLVLKEGRTSGNALGLTFDGTFDNASSEIDVKGNIIPLSGVNKTISNIPLIGDILTGGSGSLFAATYSMKGSTKKDAPEDEAVKTTVNPLSVLTPGILRRILFE